ncbi:unnamed protein product [Taenia asiatica]|uniref:Uncharacterized protein n=1 Tax=Taenia asiatica TaxID=60517 RepID=A0A0R3WCC9_TAEAS|nr:unnamed protein product [Taenia asiatica]
MRSNCCIHINDFCDTGLLQIFFRATGITKFRIAPVLQRKSTPSIASHTNSGHIINCNVQDSFRTVILSDVSPIAFIFLPSAESSFMEDDRARILRKRSGNVAGFTRDFTAPESRRKRQGYPSNWPRACRNGRGAFRGWQDKEKRGLDQPIEIVGLYCTELRGEGWRLDSLAELDGHPAGHFGWGQPLKALSARSCRLRA